LLPAAYDNSVTVYRQSTAVPPSSAAAPPCSHGHCLLLLYITVDCLPSPTATIA
jgi:hypothetical protein